MSRDREELADLVIQARAGSREAFEALYRAYQAGIYSFILSQVREPELAADLTQQTFVRVWRSLRRLRAGAAFRAWLHRIAANLVRDHVKSGRARLEVAAEDLPEAVLVREDPGRRPDEALMAGELKAVVWQALGDLAPEQRGAVVMHHMEGMSVVDIAKATGVRPGTVMSRLARAREVLRKRLSRYVEASDEQS